MDELLELKAKLEAINAGQPLAVVLYLYGNFANYIIYSIMGSYKNYFNQSKIALDKRFNKAIFLLNSSIDLQFMKIFKLITAFL